MVDRALKPAMELRRNGASVSLVEPSSGRAFSLTPDEAFVLEHFQGAATPTQLSAEAKAHGRSIDPEAIIRLLLRLEKEGFGLGDMADLEDRAKEATSVDISLDDLLGGDATHAGNRRLAGLAAEQAAAQAPSPAPAPAPAAASGDSAQVGGAFSVSPTMHIDSKGRERITSRELFLDPYGAPPKEAETGLEFVAASSPLPEVVPYVAPTPAAPVEMPSVAPVAAAAAAAVAPYVPPPAASRLLKRLGLGLVVVALGGAFVPLPRKLEAPCQLRPKQELPLAVDRELTIKAVVASSNEWVQQGAVLVTTDAKEAEAQLAKMETEATALEQRLATLNQSLPRAVIRRLEAEVAKAERNLEAAQKTVTNLSSGSAQSAMRSLLTAAKENAEKEALVLDDAKARLAQVSKASQVTALMNSIAEKRTQEEQAKATIAAALVRSPSAGVVEFNPSATQGSKLNKGDVLARISDSRFLVTRTRLSADDAGTLAPGSKVSVLIAGKPLEALVTEVSAAERDATGRWVTLDLEVANESREIPVGTRGQLNIPLESRSGFSRLIHYLDRG